MAVTKAANSIVPDRPTDNFSESEWKYFCSKLLPVEAEIRLKIQQLHGARLLTSSRWPQLGVGFRASLFKIKRVDLMLNPQFRIDDSESWWIRLQIRRGVLFSLGAFKVIDEEYVDISLLVEEEQHSSIATKMMSYFSKYAL